MNKWYTSIVEIKHQNRHVKCIKCGQDIIMETEIFNDEFIENLVDKHNVAVADSYQEGLRDGVKIVREEQGKNNGG